MLKVNPPGRTFSLMAAAVPARRPPSHSGPGSAGGLFSSSSVIARAFLAHRCDPELLRDQARDDAEIHGGAPSLRAALRMSAIEGNAEATVQSGFFSV